MLQIFELYSSKLLRERHQCSVREDGCCRKFGFHGALLKGLLKVLCTLYRVLWSDNRHQNLFPPFYVHCESSKTVFFLVQCSVRFQTSGDQRTQCRFCYELLVLVNSFSQMKSDVILLLSTNFWFIR